MYRLVEQLLQPYALLLLLTALGLVNLWLRRKESRARLLGVMVPFVLLVLVSTPAVSYFALGTLEWRFPPSRERPADADGIVVLLCGYSPPDAVRPEAELAPDTMARCAHAAELYHGGPPCPVLVSGGKDDPADPGPGGAEVMRDFLLRLGVRDGDILVEPVTQTTYESAVACRPMLEARHVCKVVLVTDAVHMFRALASYRRQGVEAVPSACQHEATEFKWRSAAFVPNPKAAEDTLRVGHEWLGVLWYTLQGRV